MTGDGNAFRTGKTDVSRIFLLLKGKLMEFSSGG